MIGWGIEYLFDNHFIEGDSDDVLGNIDEKIMEKDVLRIKDKSFNRGLVGISFYVDTRLKNKSKNSFIRTFDRSYLSNLRKANSQIVNSKPENLLSEILNDMPDNKIYSQCH